MKLTLQTAALFFITSLALVSNLFGQSYEKSHLMVSGGIGLQKSVFTTGMPLTTTVEYGFNEYVSGGLTIDHIPLIKDQTGLLSFTATYVGITSNAHLSKGLDELLNTKSKLLNDKLDIYVGVTTGAYLLYFKDNTSTSSGDAWGSELYYSASFGVRYYLTKNIGVFVQKDFKGSALGKLGLTLRL
jgi:hypothetical protein